MKRKDLPESIKTMLHEMEKIEVNKFDSSHGFFGMVEKKYGIHEKKIEKLIKNLGDSYSILYQGEKCVFDYRDVYMDTIDFDLYKQHDTSVTNTISLRTRFSSSNESTSFQVIQTKNKRKSIYFFAPNNIKSPMSNESLIFFNGIYSTITGEQPNFLPIPTLEVTFKRAIFYSKKNDQRLNIDYDIAFRNFRSPLKQTQKLGPIGIVETKSLHTDSTIDHYLKKHSAQKLKRFSKFYSGIHYAYGKSLNKKYDKTVSSIKNIIQ